MNDRDEFHRLARWCDAALRRLRADNDKLRADLDALKREVVGRRPWHQHDFQSWADRELGGFKPE